MNEGSVVTEKKQRIATITFSHPAHNSLPGYLLAELTNAIDGCGEDPEVNVVILQSGGDRTFCAGASFDELASIQDVQTGLKFFMGFANVINACRKCPKFIIGRVQGKAVGGGVGLASAVDYCLATKFASVKLSELAVGIGPFVVGPAVERKLGTSSMTQLAINATGWQTAQWAREKGLYADVFDDVEGLDKAVEDLASFLSKSNPQAMAEMKKAFWEEQSHWDELLAERAAVSGKLVLSEYTKNAIERFKSKA
ncbi:MAG: enoyl-CoA hydratase/isomerase family protein [Saprospiraceae bacterium]|nr:enoyl-CoA hydratase/isomerase family protein [Saprospiraceae bacterium]